MRKKISKNVFGRTDGQVNIQDFEGFLKQGRSTYQLSRFGVYNFYLFGIIVAAGIKMREALCVSTRSGQYFSLYMFSKLIK